MLPSALRQNSLIKALNICKRKSAEANWPKCTNSRWNSCFRAKFSIGHFGKYHNILCLSPQILHKHCFQFLLGHTMVPRENKNNAYANFGGTNKEYYGIFQSGLLMSDLDVTPHMDCSSSISYLYIWLFCIFGCSAKYSMSRTQRVKSFVVVPNHLFFLYFISH